MTNTKASLIDAAWSGGFSPYPSAEGLTELLVRQVRIRPDALAVDAGEERLSYAELFRRASQIAHTLRASGVGVETPVGVFMGPRIEQIVAQVAICMVGGTYVPLDPDYPRERLEFMIADAGVDLVLTERRLSGLQLGDRRELCIDRERANFERNPATFEWVAGGPERRTHILYTSGSTGKPKGIEVVARGVTRLVLATNYVQLEPTDRLAQIANFSFDAAIFEVWGALLNGAEIVLIPRRSALDPSELRAELVRRGVTVMFLTTALFNLVAGACPDAFSSLRYLLMGGEKANAELIRAVLEAAPPRHLLHVYGPTESTTFATSCELGLEHVATSNVPIGRPIANTLAFILDEQQRPVGVGEVGELYIGGDGLARSYHNRPELTAERFVPVAGLRGDAAIRLYRTGDQARWRPDGLIEFIGRTDFQVKIRGHRIELEEIETALVASGLVTAAAVTVHESPAGDKSLVAHVVPRDRAGFLASQLQVHLQTKLPRFMVPSRFVTLEALPLNANGKVDRKALVAGQAQSGVFSLNAMIAATSDPLTAELAAIWADLLGVQVVLPEDDFFALGGNSLLAARLVLRLRDVYRVHLPIYALYEAGTLRESVALLRQALRGEAIESTTPDGPQTWKADARLPEDVRAQILRTAEMPRPAADAWRTGDVLLTGVTGFLGAFLLRDLMVHTKARVHCLVRAQDVRAAAARVRQALAKYGLWQSSYAARIRVVPGDLNSPRFGLDEATFTSLATSVDAVIHSGAQVNYIQPYAAHRATNVGGTVEVVRFAATGRPKPLHHVSSVGVFGPSGFFGGKRVVRENDSLDDHLECLGLDIGYSASKWVAEKMVWAAAELGLPVAVYRPGFIMGDSRTGAGNADDFVGRSVRGAIQIGAYPDLPRQRKEFVPVDFVSRAILHIAGSADNHGRAFHLVPPDPQQSPDLNEFFALICEFGYRLKQWTYAQWVERVIQDSRERDNPLCSLLPMLFERVYRDELTRWELYEDMPTYDTSNTNAALAGSGIRFVAMDRTLVARYLRYWIATGQLPSARAPEAKRGSGQLLTGR
ncbi:amino acid adenylation domain-containing protein [Nannocystis sp. SCPEA4]|uniref:amino acid adenylation domain-containing protein n=1 Tax=Nannocystis sp. SCPEA4 TaxID=2996787 RepID=UPI0022714417|nr:amino acid adenylation domain-containing protein [Nannocystis sp. SCPEA4]MCY1056633.1 amino acid adenylation domain-containing protein [Nannocystis sp. SCPEA4]